MKALMLAVLAVTCTASAFSQGRGTVTTQPPPTTTQPPPTTQPPQPRPAPARPASPRVTVRDQSGTGLSRVKVSLSGPTPGEFRTDESGSVMLTNLRNGTYRLRFEHQDFLTLEREIVVRAPQPAAIDVTLNRAPPPPPPPAPEPPPPPKVEPPTPPPSGPPVTLSLLEYIDKNFIGGREPMKESILACNGLETVRLLQLREPLAEHTHDNMNEVLYVVAGEGLIRLGNAPTNLSAGSLSVVPHGTPHTLERRGRNPLILLSTLTGAPCQSAR
jgi:Carboxypeptidase regulatory-like domain/Cupin domain